MRLNNQIKESCKSYTTGSFFSTSPHCDVFEAFSDCTAVTEITSRATTPPVCGNQALDDINMWECKLYIPDGCMGVYEAADQWKEFLFKEEGIGTIEQYMLGDANSDGKVNATDIVEMVNAMNGHPSAKYNAQNADIDGNGVVNQIDIDAIVNIIMNK